MFASLLKSIIKDTDEQTAEILDRPSVGGRCALALVSLWSWAMSPSWYLDDVHPPGSSLNPILLEFLWRLHYVGMISF